MWPNCSLTDLYKSTARPFSPPAFWWLMRHINPPAWQDSDSSFCVNLFCPSVTDDEVEGERKLSCLLHYVSSSIRATYQCHGHTRNLQGCGLLSLVWAGSKHSEPKLRKAVSSMVPPPPLLSCVEQAWWPIPIILVLGGWNKRVMVCWRPAWVYSEPGF